MKKIDMPKGASYIISKLYDNGYEAYIVGGCVRDALLGKKPYDYDITTNAPPAEVKRIFDKTVDTGIAHGTVTVIEESIPYEVTAYRIDGEYKDMRHPEEVRYTQSLKDDLERRDFTVNAMAYNEIDGLIDEFCGRNDLKDKLIRTVKEPEKRFTEDALRILRGLRFSSVLDFDIEEKTSKAIKKLAPNLMCVSAERIFAEWKKLLSGKRAYEVISEYFDVIKVFLPELSVLKLPSNEEFDVLTPLERFISLFVYSGKDVAFLSAVKRLKTDAKTKNIGVAVLKNLITFESLEKYGLRSLLIENDDEVMISAAKISEAFEFCESGTAKEVEKIIMADTPRKISQLDINGNDLISLGLKGAEVGCALKELLSLVANGKVKNNKDELLAYAESKHCF